MRLVTFSVGKTPARLGAVLGPWDAWEGIVDLHRADPRLPEDVLSFVDACGSLSGATWQLATKTVEAAAKGSRQKGTARVHPVGKVALHAPITPRLLRDFLAFRGHVTRTRAARGSTVPPEWDALPAYYNGNHLNVVGPGTRIDRPRYVLHDAGRRTLLATTQLDYEAEIGYIVGRDARDVGVPQASAYLFGVTIFNDFSARDLQGVATRVGMGPPPGKDWVNALGPCLVTRDEFGALAGQRVSVRVNDETRLDGTFEDLALHHPLLAEGQRPLWSFEEMMDFLSHGQGVRAGEVWGSGTIPGGCEFEKGAEARYLADGDTVDITIEGIGTLSNSVAPAPR